jgi:hypothetical protein
VRIGGSGTEFFRRFNTREFEEETCEVFSRFTREKSQSIQYILNLLRCKSTNCSYLYTKDQEGDTWLNTWQGGDTWQWKVNQYMARGEVNRYVAGGEVHSQGFSVSTQGHVTLG